MRHLRSIYVAAGRAAAVIAVASAVSPAGAADCAPPSVVEVHQLHDRWAQSLATMHPDKVLRNYAGDATFIGLESTRLLSEFLAVRNYYVYFLQREAKIQIVDRVARAHCDSASEVGTMVMSARPKSKAPYEAFPVRYSISYERRDGKWLIVHHHLSISEESGGPPATAAATSSAPKAPAVAGFLKRLPPAKARTPTPPPAGATEQLSNGWTYTPGIWRNGAPNFQGD